MTNTSEWEKPVLIVLGRGTPEENVLTNCKVADDKIGASSANLGCEVTPPAGCANCNAIGAT
jgi:hypothetical protein